MYSCPFPSIYYADDSFNENSREERETFVETLVAVLQKVVMEKITKLFPAYLMSPANHETFHSRNFVVYGIVFNKLSTLKSN